MNSEQIEYWNGDAGVVWVAQQERLDRQLDALGRAAFAALAPRAGEHILDVGCGSGTTSLQLADAVGPTGRVVGVDISLPLLAAARRRTRGPHVSFIEADAQTHPFAPVDGVYSRFGVMFFADPFAAFANLRRALRPGGRVAFVCWRSVDENPMMAGPMAAAAKYFPPLPPPDPHAPGPFAFADRGRVARILEAAGFGAVGIEPHDEPVGGNDRADTLELALNLGPLGRLLREHPERRAVATDAVRDAIEPFIVDGVARFPTATWIVTAKS
ncbi:MAG TPA: class I SAM-dependent methyltransferase [Haliangiales bacterium]|nr:class I SAM-dependent methyltransferase [Haliangiales bacterium]